MCRFARLCSTLTWASWLQKGYDGVPISTMFWGNHYVDIFTLLVGVAFKDAPLMHIVGFEDMNEDVEKWWKVTTPDSFSGGKAMLAQPCAPLPRVASNADCLGNYKSDERRNVAYTRGVHFQSIHQLWECLHNNGNSKPWGKHYQCVCVR